MGTALGLARQGVHPVVLIERADTLGGIPANYRRREGGVPTFVVWSRGRVLFGQQFVEELTSKLDRTDTERYLETEVLGAAGSRRQLTILSPRTGQKDRTADAIVLACGAREKSRAERGWIAGSRPARLYHTLPLLRLLDEHACLPTRHPAIIGSDLIALSAAAKLAAAGANPAAMIDRRRRPQATRAERLYFHRWCRPAWHPVEGSVEIEGDLAVDSIRIKGDQRATCDGVVLSGELTPNSELLVAAGLEVRMPERVPVAGRGFALSEPGWFAAGNILGGLHGAEWCYFNGRRVAKAVARYLKTIT
jgi:NADPH-dependent 2,4-dienoyl-CoA reductase/sulfur reductase-like enzyme